MRCFVESSNQDTWRENNKKEVLEQNLRPLLFLTERTLVDIELARDINKRYERSGTAQGHLLLGMPRSHLTAIRPKQAVGEVAQASLPFLGSGFRE